VKEYGNQPLCYHFMSQELCNNNWFLLVFAYYIAIPMVKRWSGMLKYFQRRELTLLFLHRDHNIHIQEE